MTNQTANKITHIIINSACLFYRLHDAYCEKVFGQKLKQKAKIFLDELKIVEQKFYNDFLDKKEDSTCGVYDVYDNFIKEISETEIYDMQNITMLIKAYKKDKKSLEGICKKILKNEI